jgi:hypothetical protein
LTVRLRPVTGADELLVDGTDPDTATMLLGRLATDSHDAAIDLGILTLTQIDRLLSTLYDVLYGDRAECRARCSQCREDYEFSVKLSELMAKQETERPGPAGADGAWALPDGRRVRAPTLADMAAATDEKSMLARLVVEGDRTVNAETVTEFLERAAPVLSLNLDAGCPHCGAAETVRFDLGRYLAQRLASERPFLLREAHLIASRYGWTHREIMLLTRSDRRAYAALIESEYRNSQRTGRTG